MSEQSTTTPAPVLTAEGRIWLEARLARMSDRLEHIAAELENERTAELVAERQQVLEQRDELTTLLRVAVAPGDVVDDPTIVELGDEVEVAFPDGSREAFLVVHPAEAGLDDHRTSSEAPLAQAVLRHRVGDRVTVRSPAGVYSATILSRHRIDQAR